MGEEILINIFPNLFDTSLCWPSLILSSQLLKNLLMKSD